MEVSTTIVAALAAIGFVTHRCKADSTTIVAAAIDSAFQRVGAL